MATEEEIAADPEAFDCEQCPRRQMEATLGEDDWQALDLWSWLQRRVVHDLKLVPMVFEMLGLRVTRAEAKALLEKLALIHNARRPVAVSAADAETDRE